MPLEDFYLDYQKNAMEQGEFVQAIRVPLPAPGQRFRTYKLSKRFDQDISAVCAAFSITLDDDATIVQAKVAYRGVAATPKRAAHAEAMLLGQPWTRATARAAMAAMAQDYQPLSDMRATSAYRLMTAQNLVLRYYLETRPQEPLPASQTSVFAAEQTTEAV
jgi:xanthine dehydrogenase small subunit